MSIGIGSCNLQEALHFWLGRVKFGWPILVESVSEAVSDPDVREYIKILILDAALFSNIH